MLVSMKREDWQNKVFSFSKAKMVSERIKMFVSLYSFCNYIFMEILSESLKMLRW